MESLEKDLIILPLCRSLAVQLVRDIPLLVICIFSVVAATMFEVVMMFEVATIFKAATMFKVVTMFEAATMFKVVMMFEVVTMFNLSHS